ncbi:MULTISPECIES: hypothetical protein [unclassified Agrococcus]|uniref:hypothetical protein n=1 Tax=unclassified Agrococcus TaxID=2615065 RepID=UPI0036115609
MDDVALTKRICALLGTLDGWSWQPDGPAYSPTVVGVHYGPTKGPGRAVGVTVYATADVRHLSQRRVQLKHLGAPDDPKGADALVDQSFPLLRDLCRWRGILGASDRRTVPLGVDASRRQGRTENWLITLDTEEETP